MMIGQFHTRWLVWYRPSSVITLFITCRVSRALFNGGDSPSGTENVDPDKILPRCWLDRSAVLSLILPMNTSLISRIIRADIRAPINRAEKFTRAICHVQLQECLRTECEVLSRQDMFTIDLREAKAVISVRKFGNRSEINRNALSAANWPACKRNQLHQARLA